MPVNQSGPCPPPFQLSIPQFKLDDDELSQLSKAICGGGGCPCACGCCEEDEKEPKALLQVIDYTGVPPEITNFYELKLAGGQWKYEDQNSGVYLYLYCVGDDWFVDVIKNGYLNNRRLTYKLECNATNKYLSVSRKGQFFLGVFRPCKPEDKNKKHKCPCCCCKEGTEKSKVTVSVMDYTGTDDNMTGGYELEFNNSNKQWKYEDTNSGFYLYLYCSGGFWYIDIIKTSYNNGQRIKFTLDCDLNTGFISGGSTDSFEVDTQIPCENDPCGNKGTGNRCPCGCCKQGKEKGQATVSLTDHTGVGESVSGGYLLDFNNGQWDYGSAQSLYLRLFCENGFWKIGIIKNGYNNGEERIFLLNCDINTGYLSGGDNTSFTIESSKPCDEDTGGGSGAKCPCCCCKQGKEKQKANIHITDHTNQDENDDISGDYELTFESGQWKYENTGSGVYLTLYCVNGAWFIDITKRDYNNSQKLTFQLDCNINTGYLSGGSNNNFEINGYKPCDETSPCADGGGTTDCPCACGCCKPGTELQTASISVTDYTGTQPDVSGTYNLSFNDGQWTYTSADTGLSITLACAGGVWSVTITKGGQSTTFSLKCTVSAGQENGILFGGSETTFKVSLTRPCDTSDSGGGGGNQCCDPNPCTELANSVTINITDNSNLPPNISGQHTLTKNDNILVKTDPQAGYTIKLYTVNGCWYLEVIKGQTSFIQPLRIQNGTVFNNFGTYIVNPFPRPCATNDGGGGGPGGPGGCPGLTCPPPNCPTTYEAALQILQQYAAQHGYQLYDWMHSVPFSFVTVEANGPRPNCCYQFNAGIVHPKNANFVPPPAPFVTNPYAGHFDINHDYNNTSTNVYFSCDPTKPCCGFQSLLPEEGFQSILPEEYKSTSFCGCKEEYEPAPKVYIHLKDLDSDPNKPDLSGVYELQLASQGPSLCYWYGEFDKSGFKYSITLVHILKDESPICGIFYASVDYFIPPSSGNYKSQYITDGSLIDKCTISLMSPPCNKSDH